VFWCFGVLVFWCFGVLENSKVIYLKPQNQNTLKP